MSQTPTSSDRRFVAEHAAPKPSASTSSQRLKRLPYYIHPGELRPRPFYEAVKVVTDRVLAAVLLVPAVPIIFVSAVLVKLTSRGPAFYTQIRLGRHGKPYRLFKIRTMYHQCELLTGPRWAVPGDKRITPVGHYLRETHLDELPQLINVLRGDMSLVGPRPERPEIVPSLEAQIPGYVQRLAVRPGVTGLAQLQLPADTDIESVRRKLSYDLYYIRQRNYWLDLKLIVCTAFKMFGMSYSMQRRLFKLPHPEEVARVSRLPLEPAPATS